MVLDEIRKWPPLRAYPSRMCRNTFLVKKPTRSCHERFSQRMHDTSDADDLNVSFLPQELVEDLSTFQP